MDNQAELDGRNEISLRGNVGIVATDLDQLDDKKETNATGESERGTVGGCVPPS